MARNYVIPPDIVPNLKTGKCALFVGAGLSMRAGYPSWKGLLKVLIQRAVDRRLIVDGSQQHEELLDHADKPEDALLTAQALNDIFGPSKFRDEVANVFGANLPPVRAHDLLISLPFNFIATTNYDQLLENAYILHKRRMPVFYTYQQVADFASSLWRGDFFILKAHGDVNTRQSMVITERDYYELIYASSGYRVTMSSIFTMKTVLFMGASLNDPEMKLLLRYLFESFHGGGPTHYAFVPRTEFTDVATAQWLRDYNVQCIPYEPSDNTHPEVDEFLEDLVASI